MSSEGFLSLEIVPLSAFERMGKEDVLLAVQYGAAPAAVLDPSNRLVAVSNPLLGSEPVVEVWRTPETPHRCEERSLRWSEVSSVLAGTGSCELGADAAESARGLIGELLGQIERRNFPYLLRTWFYVPRINDGHGDLEIYRQFNRGRAAAFAERPGRLFAASSAVGTPGTRLIVVFLAARNPPCHLPNPRQVEAFEYPREYGSVPPSFRRATVAPPELGGLLFVAGTASVVGHESRHPGSVSDQLEETFQNLRVLLGQPELRKRGFGRGLSSFGLVKVYLRDRGSYALVERRLREQFGGILPYLVLEAEICRKELLVEIEAVGFPERDGPSGSVSA